MEASSTCSAPRSPGDLINESNKFSCNECKRRRIKCTRQVPVCALCSKYKRHCLYEKHSKTPLTRKHLTEVEEELNLVKQLLVKYIPDIDLSRLLEKVRNGIDICDIPEVNLYLDESNTKRRRLKHSSDKSGDINNINLPSSESNISTSNDLNSNNTVTFQNNTGMNIQSLLTVDNNSHKDKLQVQEGEVLGDFQIPQLLPSSINIGQKYKINHDNHFSQKKKVHKILESPTSVNTSYNWDERNQSENRQPSIIDGMATAEENGYLGTASSAALINLVGGGFFLHERNLKKRKCKHDDATNSPTLSSSSIGCTNSKKKITKQKLEEHINHYFETYHISYPIIHKAIFMAQFNEIIAPPSTCWEGLLYIVAAIGSFMSATSPDENNDLDLFDIAKSKLSIAVLETGNITLVQTLTLMSNYLQKRDKPNSGYNYLGLAVRMALGLGMHKQIDESDESLLDQEIRRRIWWCLYIFDCGQTITYGRPLGIPCAGIDARLPLNIMDSDLTAFSDKLPDEEDQPTIFTSVRLQSLFHLLTNSIYERIITDPFPTAQILLYWDQQYLERWKKLIPNYFKEGVDVETKFKLAHSVLEWRYRNLKIIMFRTFLLKKVIVNSKDFNGDSNDEFESKAGEFCLQECSSTIESMEKFWKKKIKKNRMDAWYSLYFLIPAVLMPLVCLRNEPTSIFAEYWKYDVMSAQNIIRSLMDICPSASNILDIIESMSTGYLNNQMYDNNNTELPYEISGTDESPLSQLNQLHLMLWPVSFDIEQQFLQ